MTKLTVTAEVYQDRWDTLMETLAAEGVDADRMWDDLSVYAIERTIDILEGDEPVDFDDLAQEVKQEYEQMGL